MKVKYMYILIDMTCKSHMLELLQSEHFFLPIFIRAPYSDKSVWIFARSDMTLTLYKRS